MPNVHVDIILSILKIEDIILNKNKFKGGNHNDCHL